MRPISPRAWLQYISVFALLVVLGTFALWYAWYVRERREELVGRNLRLVEAFGVHLAQSLSATRRALDRFIDESSTDNFEKVDPPKAALVARLRAMFRDRSFTGLQAAPAPANAAAPPEAKASPQASAKAPTEARPPPGAVEMTINAPPTLEFKKKTSGSAPPQIVTLKVDLSLLLK